MKRVITAFFLLLAAPSLALATEWNLVTLNRTIDETNFVVDGVCSGTLINREYRYILTNYHCVDDRITSVEKEVVDENGYVRKVKMRRLNDVNVSQHKYRKFEQIGVVSYVAEIAADSKKDDLALLQIKGEIPNQFAVRISDEVTRGETVYSVGNPLGLDATITSGIISNTNRTFVLPWTGNEKVAMIQFSAAIAPGNSGGALYNEEGVLIGVPAATYATSHLALAIPGVTIKAFLKRSCKMHAFADKEVAEKADKACEESKKRESKAAKKDEK